MKNQKEAGTGPFFKKTFIYKIRPALMDWPFMTQVADKERKF